MVEEGFAGKVGGPGGFDGRSQMAEVEFFGDSVLAVVFHHALDVHLLAVIFLMGIDDAGGEVFAASETFDG